MSFLFSIASVHAQTNITAEIKPVITFKPIYPKEAILARIEGYVDVQFTVDIHGSVKDTFVVKSKPKKIFNQAAIQAILEYKFSPQLLDSVPIEQIATQRIEFKLSQELLLKAPTLLEIFSRNKPTDIPFMAVYDLQMENKDNSSFTEVMVVDSKEEIEDTLLVWQNRKETIPNFLSIQDKIITQAKTDFINTHGAFNQFHKLCLSSTCPPILLTKLNSLPYNDFVKFITLKVSIEIDNKGSVVSYKIKKSPRKYKNNPAIKTMLSQLNFLPSTKKNKPVSSVVSATINAFATSQKTNFFLWGKERLYLIKKKPTNWVRVALISNKKGRVLEAKAIDSSDSIFESEAVNGIKNHIFPKGKTRYQLIKTINFNL